MSTEDEARLRRHVAALATVNRQLHAQVADVVPARRSMLAKEWLEQILATRVEDDPVLVRGRSGVFVLEGGRRRAVRSGLLAGALEEALGGRADIDEADYLHLEEGAPVEVFESSAGLPFVIVGRRRLPIRGLPVPSPIDARDALAFPEGPELRLRAGGGEQREIGPDPDALPLPTFLIIGAQKSATRWLRSNLGRHPDVFAAPHEPSFFNHEDAFHDRGLRWYRTQFEGWSGERLVGESTPGYMMWRHNPDLVARRIHKVLPDVRLLAILRDPIDRARSAMLHHQKRGRIPAKARLIDLVRATPPEQDQLGLVAGGWYAASLEPYREVFGDQLLVLLHDDLADDAAGVYRRSLEHIGADERFVPSELEQVRFSNRRRDDRPSDMTTDEQAELWELFREDVTRLEQLIDRDLSVWDPTTARADVEPAPGSDRRDPAGEAQGAPGPQGDDGDAADRSDDEETT